MGSNYVNQFNLTELISENQYLNSLAVAILEKHQNFHNLCSSCNMGFFAAELCLFCGEEKFENADELTDHLELEHD